MMRTACGKGLVSALLFMLCAVLQIGEVQAQACPAGRFCYYVPPDMTYGHSSGAWDLVIASSFGTVTGTYKIGPAAAIPFSVTPGTPLIVPLNETQGVVTANPQANPIGYERAEQRGIFVNASSDSLNVVHRRSSGNEQSSATIKDHTRALGQRFRLGGYALNGLGGYENASYDIVSIYAPTGGTVTVSAPPGAPTPFWRSFNTNTINISLAAGETYMLRTRDANSGGAACAYDIDGALVTSDRPVAIVSGGRGWAPNSGVSCSNNGGCGDDGVDNIFPTAFIGTEYVVASYGTNGARRVAVIADEDGTQVRVNGTLAATLNAGQRHQFQESGGATYILTSKPAYVYQNSGRDGSCEMDIAFVPPVSFASTVINTAAFNVVGNGSVRILIETAKISGLRFNGNPLMGATTTAVPGKPEWSVVGFNVAAGNHVVTSAGDFQLGLVTDTGPSGLFGYYNIFNLPFCGDGNIDPNEGCDDGDRINGDGCSAQCRIEVGTGGCVEDSDCVAGGFCNAQNVCVACLVNTDCNDGNTCTTDTCSAGACSNTVNMQGAACAGGVCNGDMGAPACVTCVDTQPGLLQDVGCPAGSPVCDSSTGAPRCVGCLINANCNDNNPCTADACTSGACVQTPVAAGTSCNAGAGVCNGSAASPACEVCVDSSPSGTDSGCTAAAPNCDRSGAQPVCVACITNAQCMAGQVCGSANTCLNAAVAITDPANNARLNTTSPTLRGTATEGEFVAVELVNSMGTVIASANVRAIGGMWSLPVAGLTDGATYTVRASVIANGGPVNATPVSFTVDTTAPAVAITAPTAGARTNDTTPTLSGTASDAGGGAVGVAVTVTNALGMTVFTSMLMPNGMGAWSVDATMLADGLYQLSVVATDAAGNTASAGPRAFTVDTAPPAVAITAPANNARTNDTTPTVSGTAEVGSTVIVTIRDAAMVVVFTGPAPVNGAGTWTVDSSMLGQGTYTVSVSATDAANNAAAAGPNTFTIDTAPPAVALTAPANNARTNDTTPTVSGTAEVGGTVIVTIRNAANAVVFTGSAPVSGAGTWTVDSSALGQGTYTVSAAATDAAGNSATAGPNTFIVDTAPPAVAITAPVNNARTNDTTPTVSGTAEVGATVVVTIRDAANAVVFTGPAPVTGAGTWTVDSSMLGQGTYTVSAVATDAANNSATAGPNTFIVDTAPPAVAITAPVNNAQLNDTTPTVSGTAEVGSTVIVTIRNAAMAVVFTGPAPVNGAGTWTVDSSMLMAGAYTVSAVATDAANNSATAGPNTFTIDNSPPSVAITTPANNAVLNDTTPTVLGTAEVGSTVIVTIRNAANAVVFTGPAPVSLAGTWSVDSAALPEGSYTVSAVATDAAGNSATAGPRSFSIDTLAPAVSLVSPANGSATSDNTPTISGAGEPGATVEVFIDNVSVGTVVIPAGGMWSLTPATALLDGAHTVRVTATDAGGNTASAGPNNFLVDTQAPLTLITSPANNTVTSNVRPSLSGTSEPGAQVELELRDAQGAVIFTQTVTADAMTGAWSAMLGADLLNGAYTLTAEATDAAGNAGQPATSSFTVDTSALPIDITAPADGAALATNRPTFEGTTAPLISISVIVTDAQGMVVEAVQAISDVNGDWSVQAVMALFDGAYTVTATVQSVAGVNSSDSASFTLDTAPPQVTLNTPVDGAALNVAQPVISGTSEAGAEIEVELLDAQGAVIETLVATADMLGAWSVTPAMALVDGAYTVSATASDRAGNATTAGPNDFTVDTLAPALSLLTPVDGAVSGVRDVVVSGVSDAGQEVVIELLDAQGAVVGTQTVVADGMGAYSATFQNLANGGYTATASATDAAGNSSDAMVTFSVDSEQPVLVVNTPADGAVSATGALIVSGTADADATVTVVVRDAGGNTVFSGPATVNMDGTFSLTLTPALMDGAYVVEVTATRPNGLSTSEDRDVVVDQTAPVTMISQPGAGAVVGSATPTITGTSEPNSVVTITIDGMVVGTATTDANGMWSFAVTTPLAEGPHAISASATDAAGNMGQPATVNFTVDLSAPMVTITAPMAGQRVGDTSPTITGTAPPNSIVTIIIDGVEVGTAITDGQGNWGYDSLELSEGTHTVEARVTDAAGNAGSSGEVSFEIKVSAPVAILTPVNGGMITGPSVTVTGTGEPGATVTVTAGGQTKTVVVGEDGSWSVTFDDVPAGAVTVEASDGDSMTSVMFTVNDPVDNTQSDVVLTGTGGCAQGAGGAASSPLWLVALGVVAMRRRRRA